MLQSLTSYNEIYSVIVVSSELSELDYNMLRDGQFPRVMCFRKVTTLTRTELARHALSRSFDQYLLDPSNGCVYIVGPDDDVCWMWTRMHGIIWPIRGRREPELNQVGSRSGCGLVKLINSASERYLEKENEL